MIIASNLHYRFQARSSLYHRFSYFRYRIGMCVHESDMLSMYVCLHKNGKPLLLRYILLDAISIFVAPAHHLTGATKKFAQRMKYNALLFCCNTMKPFLSVRCILHCAHYQTDGPAETDSMHILALKICNENWTKTKHTVSVSVFVRVCACAEHIVFW